MKKEKIRDITYVALFVAVIAIISQVSVPLAGLAPITLQIYAVSMCGYVLGVKRGLLSILVFIALGAVGVPVFSSLQGGIHVLLSYTGGFIFGFIPLTVMCGIYRKRRLGIVFGIIGVLICHLLGIIWYSVVADMNFVASFIAVSLPFLVKDIILCILSFFASANLREKSKL